MLTDLLSSYAINVVYNPELLREASAKEDFANPTYTNIWTSYDNTYDDAPWWADLFNERIPPIATEFTNRETASMIKYTPRMVSQKVAWLMNYMTHYNP